MAGIVFYFEDNDIDVWSGRNSDFDAWNYAIRLTSDVRNVIVINKTSNTYSPFNLDFNVQYVSEIPALTGHVTKIDCPWDSGPQTDLWNFDHLTDWYVFGPAAGWASQPFSGTINVDIPQNGNGAMHSVHAASVVMAHRYGVIG